MFKAHCLLLQLLQADHPAPSCCPSSPGTVRKPSTTSAGTASSSREASSAAAAAVSSPPAGEQQQTAAAEACTRHAGRCSSQQQQLGHLYSQPSYANVQVPAASLRRSYCKPGRGEPRRGSNYVVGRGSKQAVHAKGLQWTGDGDPVCLTTNPHSPTLLLRSTSTQVFGYNYLGHTL